MRRALATANVATLALNLDGGQVIVLGSLVLAMLGTLAIAYLVALGARRL